MKKWMLMLCFLLFFDVQMIGGMRDKTSLSTFRQAGMPVELFQKMGMKAQDMEQYLGFWEDLKYFPVAGRKEAPKARSSAVSKRGRRRSKRRALPS